MSTYLSSYFDMISLGASITAVQNILVGNLVTNGWQLLAQVDGDHSDLVPPATEIIGDGKTREVVRIAFPSNTSIRVKAYQQSIANAYPQQVLLKALMAGAVQAAVTIGGVQVLGVVGSASSSANDNLQGLFYALQDSTDPTILGWSFWYNGTDTLICTRRTIAPNVVCSANANVTFMGLSDAVQSGVIPAATCLDSTDCVIASDLTQGFVYYMSVFARSFLLATKTAAGNSIAIFASYMERADVAAALPASPLCSPVELVLGTVLPLNSISGNASAVGWAWTPHLWAIGSRWGHASVPLGGTFPTTAFQHGVGDVQTFTGAGIPGQIYDVPHCELDYYSNSTPAAPSLLYRMGLPADNGSLTSSFKVTAVGSPMKTWAPGSDLLSIRMRPTLRLPDICYWLGSEPNEFCAQANDIPVPGLTGQGLYLTQALDGTTAYPTFTISTLSGLSASGGSLFIGAEKFTYTGLGTLSVLGVLRAVDGTPARRHFVGDPILAEAWYLRFSSAAFAAGANKPF